MSAKFDSRPVVVISADSHAGADLLDYRPYLESRWLEEFDAWARTYSNPWEFEDERAQEVELRTGAASWHSVLNWDSARRLHDTEADGVAAEVIFPNTAPPFIPTTTLLAEQPKDRQDYERRWAGLKAHNRWLVDFCAEAPGRRVGVAQILLYDIDESVAEIQSAVNAGLTGGIIIPPDSSVDPVPLYERKYDKLWSVCEDLDVPIHRHGATPAARAIPELVAVGIMEATFFNIRGLHELIFAGVFDRHPRMKFVFTEVGIGWVPEHLGRMDYYFHSRECREKGSGMLSFMHSALAKLSMSPSEYFARNCWLGSSLFVPDDKPLIHGIGVDRIMWGHDYPHAEGSFPFARQVYRVMFSDSPEAEVRAILGGNAAEMYGFDLEALQPIADRIGPTLAEISEPLTNPPRVPEDTYCVTFGGMQAPADA